MKNTRIIAVLVLLALSLSGCANAERSEVSTPSSQETVTTEYEQSNMPQESIAISVSESTEITAESTAPTETVEAKSEVSIPAKEETPPVISSPTEATPPKASEPEPSTEPTETQPQEPDPPVEEKPTEPAFDIQTWIDYAKAYAESVGLRLESSAVDCWDNPISAGAHCSYLKRDIQSRLNRYARDEDPRQGRGKQYGEWRAEQEQRPTWRGLIRSDIDEAIRQAMTERQFFDALRKKGYAVKIGKDISVRPPGKERFVRLMRNFGEDYSLDNIRRRILSQSRPERRMPEQKPEILRVRLIGSLKTARKLTGFRALYVHYCYLLGIFSKNRPPQSRKRLHFLLREDLLKLDAITAETRLLIGHRIDTAEQLFCYRDEVNGKIEVLTEKRQQLYKLQRTAAVKSDPEKAVEVRAQIAALSKELAALRKGVVLCDSIAERSGVIQEKIKAVREDEQIKGKEKTDHVQFR